MALDFSCMQEEQGCYKEFILWSLSKGMSTTVKRSLQPFLRYSTSLCSQSMFQLSWNLIGNRGWLEIERKNGKFIVKLRAHVDQTRRVISYRWLDENGREMYNTEKRSCKACKATFFIVKYATVLTMLSLRLLKPSNIRGWGRPFLVGGVVWYQGRWLKVLNPGH